MFHRVQTKEDHFVFEQLWGDFCEERNIQFVERNLQPERFLLEDDGNKYIGTVECAKYVHPQESNSEYFYKFSSNSIIQRHEQNLYEIGKFMIERQFRGRGYFKRLAAILFIHALETKATTYITVVTKRMYMYLLFLGFKIDTLDKEFRINEVMIGVPIMINAYEGMKHVYSIKEIRDVIKTNAYAMQLLNNNDNRITLSE
ncbi:GNAT family N-acetyltransferase [Ectobacillus sp. sgz5001026]|uniref:GNAT family N-acetyltransferase n=1 Tax=Ectobacillus sp. sgz5001026 TaxID=3242473 RepID=UPI0036D249AF